MLEQFVGRDKHHVIALPARFMAHQRHVGPLASIAIDHRARRVQRRVDEHRPRHAEVRADLLRRSGRSSTPRTPGSRSLRAREVRVVVVVPRRHRVHGDVARIDQRAVRAVEQRPGAAGDEHRFDRVFQPELALVEAHERLAQTSTPSDGG